MKVMLTLVVNKEYYNLVIPDLGIGYLATALRNGNHTVYFFNGRKDNSYEKFESYLKRIKPDVVGFKVFFGDLAGLKSPKGRVPRACPWVNE